MFVPRAAQFMRRCLCVRLGLCPLLIVCEWPTRLGPGLAVCHLFPLSTGCSVLAR